MTVPGSRLRALAARVCASRTMTRLVDPVLADLQHEYEQAIGHGRVWRSRWIRLRGYSTFLLAMLLHTVRLVWQGAGDWMRRERPKIARTIASAIVPFALLTVAFVLGGIGLPLTDNRSWSEASRAAILIVLVLPQTFPFTIPAALCVATLWQRRGDRLNRSNGLATALLAVLGCGLVWLTMEYVLPDANQIFREQFAPGRFLERGPSELSLSELSARPDARSLRIYQDRLALCFTTGILAMCAICLSSRIRTRFGAAGAGLALSTVHFVSSLALMNSVAQQWVAPVSAAWVTNSLFIFVALAAAGFSRSAKLDDVGIGDQ